MPTINIISDTNANMNITAILHDMWKPFDTTQSCLADMYQTWRAQREMENNQFLINSDEYSIDDTSTDEDYYDQLKASFLNEDKESQINFIENYFDMLRNTKLECPAQYV